MAFTMTEDMADDILTDLLLTSTVYLSLWRTEPLRDESGTEETGTGYARETMTTGNWGALGDVGSLRGVTSGIVVDWGTVGAGGWGTGIGWVGVHTAASGAGNLRGYWDITGGARDLSTPGTPVMIPLGDLVATA